MVKNKHLQIRVSDEDVSLISAALKKAQKEGNIIVNKSVLLLWLVKRYLTGR